MLKLIGSLCALVAMTSCTNSATARKHSQRIKTAIAAIRAARCQHRPTKKADAAPVRGGVAAASIQANDDQCHIDGQRKRYPRGLLVHLSAPERCSAHGKPALRGDWWGRSHLQSFCADAGVKDDSLDLRRHQQAGWRWKTRRRLYQKLSASGGAFITCRQSKKSYSPVHSWTGVPQFLQENLL